MVLIIHLHTHNHTHVRIYSPSLSRTHTFKYTLEPNVTECMCVKVVCFINQMQIQHLPGWKINSTCQRPYRTFIKYFTIVQYACKKINNLKYHIERSNVLLWIINFKLTHINCTHYYYLFHCVFIVLWYMQRIHSRKRKYRKFCRFVRFLFRHFGLLERHRIYNYEHDVVGDFAYSNKI